MIKVHCFVSCVCEVIKRSDGVDHRPFYFGVWDADFSVSDRWVLSYHSEHTNHDFFKTWYRQLYGIEIQEWFDPRADKAANVVRLVELVENRPAHRNVMVMLDMYHLPERENKFNQNPFPHYVMLETTDDPDTWFMHDPDYRWEGPLPKARILNAVSQPSVAGGFFFDGIDVRHTADDTVRAYFATCMKHQHNPFTDALRRIVRAHLELDGVELADLESAVREIPVMAIRKYAYEHAFAFFCQALGEDLDDPYFVHWTDEVEKLVKAYTQVQYRSMKLARTGQTRVADSLFALLADQDALEFRIKEELQALFERWCEREGSSVQTESLKQEAICV